MSAPTKAESPAVQSASVDEIRRHFPALDRKHQGLPVAYFDGPGGTQVPRQVVEAVSDYLLHHDANTHWHYPSSHRNPAARFLPRDGGRARERVPSVWYATRMVSALPDPSAPCRDRAESGSQETDAALSSARQALADFLNAAPDEIAFGANMTTLTFHLARSLGRAWGSGDEIVVTELDHHANVDPWRALTKDRGVTVRTVAMRPETGQLDGEDLERALTSRTRILAIGAACNALGTVNDARRAVELAHARGALAFVDAVHAAPHVLPDMSALGCDLLACSAYKFYGPHVGVLFGRRDLVNALDAPKVEPAPNTSPEKLETGTQNHEGIVGAAAAVDFLASLAAGATRRARLEATFAALHHRGQALVEHLWAGLSVLPGVTMYGPPPSAPRTPTVAFAVAGHGSDEVSVALARRAVFVSSGDFYASTAVKRLGREKDGLVRAGCACYTTQEEVDRLIAAVAELTRRESEGPGSGRA